MKKVSVNEMQNNARNICMKQKISMLLIDSLEKKKIII
jgi:hypothetical protein